MSKAFVIREYDYIFSKNLYSFRVDNCVKKAIRRIKKISEIDSCYSYKLDVSNYFNSINIEKLLVILNEIFVNDTKVLEFLSKTLTSPYSVENGIVIEECKAIFKNQLVGDVVLHADFIHRDHYLDYSCCFVNEEANRNTAKYEYKKKRGRL